jgi:hypothetical protein
VDDGKEVVAEIPNLNAGLPKLVTSSEGTTMDFVRADLSLLRIKLIYFCRSRIHYTYPSRKYSIGVPKQLTPRWVLNTLSGWKNSWGK